MLSKVSRSLFTQKRVIRNAVRAFSDSGLTTKSTQASDVVEKEKVFQFSKDPTMSNFGDLPFGEIPEPLKYVRQFHSTTLSNGVRVCSERVPGQKASIGVYIGSGSRNETLATTGVSYLTNKMALRGTNNKSKTDLAESLEAMGARYTSKADREYNSYNLSVLKGDATKAVGLLGDMICNPAHNDAELEMVKNEVAMEHEDNHNRYVETTMENVHFNSYREHMMGQPTKGDRD